MGTVAGARKRYTGEGLQELRKQIQDLQDRGYSLKAISLGAGLYEGTVKSVRATVEAFPDTAIVEPETLERVAAFHARILENEDTEEVMKEIARRRIYQAAATMKKRRREAGKEKRGW